MKKNLITLTLGVIMALCCILGFTACGESPSQDHNDGGNNSGSTASTGLEFTLNDDGNSYSVTGVGTFDGRELIIPATYEGKPVTKIGNEAFAFCKLIYDLIVPESVTVIGRYAFYGCDSLSNVSLPDGLTTIEEGAFRSCFSIRSIYIPHSVTDVGDYAFFACSALQTVYYKGTLDEFRQIKRGSNNNPFAIGYLYFYSETEPTDAQWNESGNWWHYDEQHDPTVWTKS